MKKLKDTYIIGYGHPRYYRSGLNEGIYFYSDTDKRLSNTRDTEWPSELNDVDRAKIPQYELILRKIAPKKRNAKKRRAETNPFKKSWKTFLRYLKP